MIKWRRKQFILPIIALLGCIFALAGLSYVKTDTDRAIERYRDRSHDVALINQTNAQLDAEMKESTNLLSSQLASFGLNIPVAPKSECFEGDPALYKYACWTRVDIRDAGQTEALGTAESAAQKLADFDTIVVKKGWKIAHNDFRNQSSVSAPGQWTTAISQYPVDVSYMSATGKCSIEFYLRLASQPDYGGGTGSLSCATDLLPGFYY